jgi:hypothetical protein
MKSAISKRLDQLEDPQDPQDPYEAHERTQQQTPLGQGRGLPDGRGHRRVGRLRGCSSQKPNLSIASRVVVP